MKYILYLRPYSIGTCPDNGLIKATLPTSKDERHGILEFDRMLTIDEITHFDLLPIWESMAQFIDFLIQDGYFEKSRVGFIKSMISYASEPETDMQDIYDGIGEDIKPGGTWFVRGQFTGEEIGKFLFENFGRYFN